MMSDDDNSSPNTTMVTTSTGSRLTKPLSSKPSLNNLPATKQKHDYKKLSLTKTRLDRNYRMKNEALTSDSCKESKWNGGSKIGIEKTSNLLNEVADSSLSSTDDKPSMDYFENNLLTQPESTEEAVVRSSSPENSVESSGFLELGIRSKPNVDSNNKAVTATVTGKSVRYTAETSDIKFEEQSTVPHIMRRREANMRRNEERLANLGLEKRQQVRSDPKTFVLNDVKKYSGIKDQQKNCGMLFPTEYNSLSDFAGNKNDPNSQNQHHSMMEEIEKKYPHRSPQIRILHSMFTSSLRQGRLKVAKSAEGISHSVYIPPSIFVTGPSGSGKTTIICEMLRQIKQNETFYPQSVTFEGNSEARISTNKNYLKSSIGIAYVNCSQIESENLGMMLENAYNQLFEDFSRESTTSIDIQGKFPGLTKKIDLLNDSSGSSLIHIDNFSEIVRPSDDEDVHDKEDELDAALEDDEEDCIERERKTGRRSMGNSFRRQQGLENEKVRRSNRLGSSRNPLEKGSPSLKPIPKTTPSSRSFQTPMAFGRSISQFCGPSDYMSKINGCAFFVIDHAERLLSFSGTKKAETGVTNDRNNFLSQLLIMPKIMRLNLTIVIITNNVLLEFTGVNCVQGLESLGSIADAIHPFRCHFHAYRGKDVFRDILTTPKLRNLVTGTKYSARIVGGSVSRENFICTLHESLVEIVVQSVQNITRDIREMQRLLRLLWPLYLQPLLENKTETASLFNEFAVLFNGIKGENKLLEKLGEVSRPHVKKMLASNVLRPSQGYDSLRLSNINLSFSDRLPYLTKFVLISAYLCQKNKPHVDQMLHTNKKLSKKRRRGNGANTNIAYAVSTKMQQEIKTSRSLSFPLERVLSVFSSICRKYGKGSMLLKELSSDILDGEINEQKLGSVQFFENFTQLQHLGFLNDARSVNSSTSNSIINTPIRFTCNLSLIEAQDICDQVGFPLADYLTGQD